MSLESSTSDRKVSASSMDAPTQKWLSQSVIVQIARLRQFEGLLSVLRFEMYPKKRDISTNFTLDFADIEGSDEFAKAFRAGFVCLIVYSITSQHLPSSSEVKSLGSDLPSFQKHLYRFS